MERLSAPTAAGGRSSLVQASARQGAVRVRGKGSQIGFERQVVPDRCPASARPPHPYCSERGSSVLC